MRAVPPEARARRALLFALETVAALLALSLAITVLRLAE
jgi:hypothetical protein